MLERALGLITDPTVPPTTEPVVDSTASAGKGFASSFADLISSVFDNLGNNGYQTGLALVVATAAIITMLNLGVHRAVLAPVGVGAFWAGWLGWNTFTAQSNPLFPGDVSATKLWDVWRAGSCCWSERSSVHRSSTTSSRRSATRKHWRPAPRMRPTPNNSVAPPCA
jgi:hypothetical protein